MPFSQLKLNPLINKAIQAYGYTQPTPIQAQSIPPILAGNDLIASAETGSGKTAAFVLPALQRLAAHKSLRNPRVLVLTPTRELAAQITKAVGQYGRFLQINLVSLVGGMPYGAQLKNLAKPVDIIVATPGRLLDHLQKNHLNLSAIEMLILDEADRMLDMGFIDDVKKIASKTPRQRQTLLFTATVNAQLSAIASQLQTKAMRIDLSSQKIAPAQINQVIHLVDNLQHKNRLLLQLLPQNIYKAIIFTATKIGASRLARELRHSGYACAELHGDLKQNQRNRTIMQFHRGTIQFLVATDVAARGIDVADVSHVINYDLPKFSEDYVHRIGRTGRAGKSGHAISLVLPSDVLHLQRIERFVKSSFEIVEIPNFTATWNLDTVIPKKKKPNRQKRRRPNRSRRQK